MSGSLRMHDSPALTALQLFCRQGRALLPLTLAYAVVNALDVVMTWILLTHDQIHFVESNPIARYFIFGWGLQGMLLFKLLLVAFVTVICQIIACRQFLLAKRLMCFAVVTVSLVVLYSVGLMLLHGA